MQPIKRKFYREEICLKIDVGAVVACICATAALLFDLGEKRKSNFMKRERRERIMTTICVTVKDGKAEAKLTGVLTAGMVGVPVTFLFGPEWQPSLISVKLPETYSTNS